MSIITIEQLETALGRDLTTEQEAQAQFFIDAITAAIETYTGTTFTLQEDVTLRMQADYYGQIRLPMKPIQEVSAVEYSTNTTPTAQPVTPLFWGFDGYDTIYNLPAHVVLDVTLSYGYATAPADIQAYVVWATTGVLNNPDGLESFRVGDVTETYGQAASASGITSYAGLMQQTLDSYKDTYDTWRLGPRNYIRSPNLPLL